MSVRLAKTQISLGIRPVWSESLLSAWRKLGPLATTHWAHSEDSDQTGRIPRLIWVFTGRTVTLLVLSRGGSLLFRYGWKMCVLDLDSILCECTVHYPRLVGIIYWRKLNIASPWWSSCYMKYMIVKGFDILCRHISFVTDKTYTHCTLLSTLIMFCAKRLFLKNFHVKTHGLSREFNKLPIIKHDSIAIFCNYLKSNVWAMTENQSIFKTPDCD